MRRILGGAGFIAISFLLAIVSLQGQAKPSVPAGSVVRHRNHQAKLKWNPPGGPGAEEPKSYIIYRTKGWLKDRVVGCGKKWKPIATTPANITEYSDQNVKPGDVYCYAVSAMTARGETRKSFTASAVIPSP